MQNVERGIARSLPNVGHKTTYGVTIDNGNDHIRNEVHAWQIISTNSYNGFSTEAMHATSMISILFAMNSDTITARNHD